MATSQAKRAIRRFQSLWLTTPPAEPSGESRSCFQQSITVARLHGGEEFTPSGIRVHRRLLQADCWVVQLSSTRPASFFVRS